MASIFVKEKTLPAAWEMAVLSCWSDGDIIPTQYDKPGDPPSRDCAALIVVEDPLAEPRIHKAFPGSYGKLEEYRQEVVLGIHDGWINPDEGKWTYTYHQRFTNHPSGAEYVDGEKDESGCFGIDQRQWALRALTEAPHSRRALQSTWYPPMDCGSTEPPCVQYITDRVFGNKLVRHVHIRSNDAFKACFMNGWAFIAGQIEMAEELSVRLGRVIEVGEFRWFADSFHIYGSYFEQFKGFLDSVKNRTWEERTIRSDDESVVEAFASAREAIARGELVV